ncbi:hypothetical protein WOLCODRAFT_21597 [Wolfiporia cocos MD-104 SS10]|uniref:Uncharacterized protein n=1 Tax=Wolfiporia cocos (strain MD-104) TaxID=742152 RepID=A0A2H3JKJ9_WOLCO|nr:hypothetical protein WOLCODRAFT_21597 [Wolfiporia cocos MD-104 SS10]
MATQSVNQNRYAALNNEISENQSIRQLDNNEKIKYNEYLQELIRLKDYEIKEQDEDMREQQIRGIHTQQEYQTWKMAADESVRRINIKQGKQTVQNNDTPMQEAEHLKSITLQIRHTHHRNTEEIPSRTQTPGSDTSSTDEDQYTEAPESRSTTPTSGSTSAINPKSTITNIPNLMSSNIYKELQLDDIEVPDMTTEEEMEQDFDLLKQNIDPETGEQLTDEQVADKYDEYSRKYGIIHNETGQPWTEEEKEEYDQKQENIMDGIIDPLTEEQDDDETKSIISEEESVTDTASISSDNTEVITKFKELQDKWRDALDHGHNYDFIPKSSMGYKAYTKLTDIPEFVPSWYRREQREEIRINAQQYVRQQRQQKEKEKPTYPTNPRAHDYLKQIRRYIKFMLNRQAIRPTQARQIFMEAATECTRALQDKDGDTIMKDANIPLVDTSKKPIKIKKPTPVTTNTNIPIQPQKLKQKKQKKQTIVQIDNQEHPIIDHQDHGQDKGIGQRIVRGENNQIVAIEVHYADGHKTYENPTSSKRLDYKSKIIRMALYMVREGYWSNGTTNSFINAAEHLYIEGKNADQLQRMQIQMDIWI